ncbi:hypothetical protein H4683_003251 [Filibacter limicola]|uniref:Uncharacterized protein n=1 Tax=Sporosarcina limicola TaxID=34101 RepID=A0A927MK10_9BACL|nr:hypothetical protein [Sporosarcina limicola]
MEGVEGEFFPRGFGQSPRSFLLNYGNEFAIVAEIVAEIRNGEKFISAMGKSNGVNFGEKR